MEVIKEPSTRVQTLAQTKTEKVPPQYIQPPELRPNNYHNPPLSTSNIPLIDLSLPSDSLLTQLSSACRHWGAFHVRNHGVSTNLLRQMRAVGSSFFEDLDVSQKLMYKCDQNSPASEGYGSRMLVSENDDAVLDWRDYFDHHTFPISRRNPSRWPHYPPNYRSPFAYRCFCDCIQFCKFSLSMLLIFSWCLISRRFSS